MSKVQFSLNIVLDKHIGYVYIPYLLRNYKAEHFQKHKIITNQDVKNNIFPFTNWQHEIIKLTNSLTYLELNNQFNKKKATSTFPIFLDKVDKGTKKFITNTIENKLIKIAEFIKENSPLLFSISDRDSNIYPKDFIKIENERAKVNFVFKKNNENLIYKLNIRHKGKIIDLQADNLMVLTNKNPSIIYKNKMIWFENENFNGNKLKPFLNKKQIEYQKKHEAFLFEKFIKPAVKTFNCDISGFEFKSVEVKFKAYLYIEQTIFKDFIFTPFFVYNEFKTPFYSSQTQFIKVIDNKGVYSLESVKRDYKKEQEFLNKLAVLELVKTTKFYKHKVKFEDKYEFFKHSNAIILKLKNTDFIIVNRLFKNELSYEKSEIIYDYKANIDWFDLYITIKFGKLKIEFQDLKNHILNGIYEYILPDNTIAIIPKEWFTELNSFAKRTNHKNKTAIHKTHFSLLENNSLLAPNLEIKKRIDNFKIDKKLSLPITSVAKLRDYQVIGYNWLYKLTTHQFGVCLADDMGLGKTLQVITLLQKYFEENTTQLSIKDKHIANIEPHKSDMQLSLFDVVEERQSQSIENESTSNTWSSVLLVVPKSLIYNWILELEKFAPNLSFAIYHDNNRAQAFNKSINKKNIIITTYGVVRQDIDFLEQYNFSYLILDESHIIKNPNSKTYKSIIKLNSTYKISITGTPFENRLTDLWSQMNFLNDNILGDLPYFDKTYVSSIKNNSVAPELEELKTIIRPFIIRRLKKDVAKDLPEKIEHIVYCQMHKDQSKWYEEEKSKVRNELTVNKNKKSYIDILASINKLRQIAIHPTLQNVDSKFSSGKFETIIQYVLSIIEQGDKFLIFSSFVKHLQLFKDYFETQKIPYSMLTGKDNNRQEIVEEYEKSDDIKPFLISIKAGGVGINLTSANYVFIIDPWWNPFVEQQAIDRTHRIGQDKNVIVYRFISKDTIEEKIMTLQQSKLNMNDSIFDKEIVENIKLDKIISLI